MAGTALKRLRDEINKELTQYCTLQTLMGLKAEMIMDKAKASKVHEGFHQDLEEMKISIKSLDANLCHKVNNHHMKLFQTNVAKEYIKAKDLDSLIDSIEMKAK